MARAPIEIGIASETKAFKQGMESGVIKPTEDAIDALDDLGKTRGPEQLDREMGEAQKATKNLGKEVERTADDIEDSFRKAYKGVERAQDDAKQGMSDFKDESKQSLRETSASISSVEDGLDAVQEIAANAFVGFGPAGVAGGLVAATGIGLATAAITETKAAAEEARQQLIDMYRDAAEEGRTFLSEAQVTAAALEVFTDPDKFKRAREEAAKLGVDVNSYVRAISGDASELNSVLDFGASKLAELSKIGEDKSTAGRAAALAEKQAYENALLPLERTAEQHKLNQDAARAYEEFTSESQTKQREQINRTADIASARLTALANQGVEVKLTVDDSEVKRSLAEAQRNAKIRLEVTDRYGRNI